MWAIQLQQRAPAASSSTSAVAVCVAIADELFGREEEGQQGNQEE